MGSGGEILVVGSGVVVGGVHWCRELCRGSALAVWPGVSSLCPPRLLLISSSSPHLVAFRKWSLGPPQAVFAIVPRRAFRRPLGVVSHAGCVVAASPLLGRTGAVLGRTGREGAEGGREGGLGERHPGAPMGPA